MINEKVWNYLKDCSIQEGLREDKKTGELVDAPYSIAWFFNDAELKGCDKLNPITKAFLGDEDALGSMSCTPADKVPDALPDRIKDVCPDQINDSQLRAIASAVTNSVTAVQGPPGTGKTRTIANLLLYIRRCEPDATAAVLSCNKEAIENIIDSVDKIEELRNAYAYLGSYGRRNAFADVLEDSEDKRLQEIAASYKALNKNDWKRYRRRVGFDPDLLQYYPIIFSTIHSIRKCIEPKKGFDNHFDYVIIDETSQVKPALGLLAMESAGRHLVLFGDTKQLPPIYTKETDSVTEAVPDYCLHEGNNNFMDACVKRFGDKCSSVFLNEHYRCHPGIIGFCNENVYDGMLRICTADDGLLPMRVRWYEGDYWERVLVQEKAQDARSSADEEPRDVRKNLNRRQIVSFMTEEYPELCRRLREDPEFSCCIISPYNYQLEILKQAIEQYNMENGIAESDGPVLSKKDPLVNDIPSLTIHKVQGKEFDMVCFMPVIDSYTKAGQAEWIQTQEKINVVVSRAKKEFCLLCSSVWLPDSLQEAETGCCLSEESGIDGNHALYLRILTEYIKEHGNEESDQAGFGFVRSSIRSVFDRVPYYRQYADLPWKQETDYAMPISAPERCLMEAMLDEQRITGQYMIYREVPLQTVPAIASEDEEKEKYIANARFDFVLVGRDDGDIHLIIEVDGAQHRRDRTAMHRDELKDELVGEMDSDGKIKEFRYLRLYTDGTGSEEIEKICGCLEKAEEEKIPAVRWDPEPGSMRDNKVDAGYCRRLMAEDALYKVCRQAESDMCEAGEQEVQTVLNTVLNYRKGGENNKKIPDKEYHYDDTLVDSCYMWKYGRAYAFEYSAIFKAIIADYLRSCGLAADEEAEAGQAAEAAEAPYLGAVDVGCGSMIAGWSLAYASTFFPENPVRYRYAGVDETEWPLSFAQDPMLCSFYERTDKAGLRFEQMDIVRFSKENNLWKNYNILMFSKILNELDDDQLAQLLKTIRRRIKGGKGNPPKTQIYYLVVCHTDSRGDIDRVVDFVEKLVSSLADRFEVQEKFIREDDFYRGSSMPDEHWLQGDFHRGGKSAYIYQGCAQDKFYKLDRTFDGNLFRSQGRRIDDICGDMNAVTYTKYIRFQIIRLKRK